MKKLIFFSLTFLLIGTMGVNAQMAMPVKDKAKASVLNNTEFMNLQRLQPESYHYWIWYKKIFGIKIPMPGLGLHDKYGKKDMRLVFQEAPTLAAISYNKDKTEEYHKEVDKVFMQETAKFADRSIDTQYLLTKEERRDLLDAINRELVKYAMNKGDLMHIKALTDEVIRINANVEIIKDSHMGTAKKREAYLNFNKELQEVHKKVVKLNRINKVIK